MSISDADDMGVVKKRGLFCLFTKRSSSFLVISTTDVKPYVTSHHATSVSDSA